MLRYFGDQSDCEFSDRSTETWSYLAVVHDNPHKPTKIEAAYVLHKDIRVRSRESPRKTDPKKLQALSRLFDSVISE